MEDKLQEENIVLINIGSITPNFVRTQIGEFRSVDYRGRRIYGLKSLYLRLP